MFILKILEKNRINKIKIWNVVCFKMNKMKIFSMKWNSIMNDGKLSRSES